MNVVFVDNNEVQTRLYFAFLLLSSIANAGPSVLGTISSPSSSGASAGGLDAAMQRLSEAQAKFYQASKQPGITPQEMLRLRNQIVSPAQESMQQAISQERTSTLRKYTRVGKLTGGGLQANTPAREGTQSSKPGLQLDGSGIKRELEFKPRTSPSGAK